MTHITKKVIGDHGISEEEFQKIVSILGREPNITELGIFSVMWSEHCSYKSSKKHLATFPTTGPQVIYGPGENAGVVDIGDGDVAVFKMESHNHPSFIEPYEGAATGVGGILRDVFTMGARPIALLDSLRFGSPAHPRTRYLVNGVVSGIAAYGNCVGVPTVGGEMAFNSSFDGNILVNVFCLGIAKKEGIFTCKAAGIGNPVIYVGSKTGRDGIHGATMASGEFDEESEEKRPTVQVGDPFTEKLLIEACLEAMKSGAILAIQDMGAAGLTSTSCEMAGKGGTGIELYIDRVPRREEGMTPYEVLLSESQERMLLVAHKGKEERLFEIFKKWDLDVAEVGRVTGDGMFRVMDKGKIAAEIPVQEISNNAPEYDRPSREPEYFSEAAAFDLNSIGKPENYDDVLVTLLSSLNFSDKKWVYQQYDHMIRTNTVILPGSDASVLRIKGSNKGVAISVDCNSRYCYLDPYTGGKIAVAESARNVACSGGRPLAITDNLNFGNPEKPEVMWQLKECVRGIVEACETLGIPVVSGNVSLYNETRGNGIFPTPTIGTVGIVKDIGKVVPQWFSGAEEIILLLGENRGEIGGSEYLSRIHGIESGKIPEIDLQKEKNLIEALAEGIESGIVRSAHDCSEGGIGIALAECCITGPKPCGAATDLSPASRDDFLLFGESQSRVILSVSERERDHMVSICEKYGVPTACIGKTGGEKLIIRVNNKEIISCEIGKIKKAWENALPDYMENGNRSI